MNKMLNFKDTMGPIEPPCQAIKERVPDDEPDLDWLSRPRNFSTPRRMALPKLNVAGP